MSALCHRIFWLKGPWFLRQVCAGDGNLLKLGALNSYKIDYSPAAGLAKSTKPAQGPEMPIRPFNPGLPRYVCRRRSAV